MFRRSSFVDILYRAEQENREVSVIPTTRIDSDNYWLLATDSSNIQELVIASTFTYTFMIHSLLSVSKEIASLVHSSLQVYPSNTVVWTSDNLRYIVFVPVPPLTSIPKPKLLNGCKLLWFKTEFILLKEDINRFSGTLKSFLTFCRTQ